MTQSVVRLSMHKLGFLFIFCLLLFGSCISIPKEYKKYKGNIYRKHDPFKSISFYQHKDKLLRHLSFGYKFREFNLYVSQKDKDKTLRIKFIYDGQSWIFLNKLFY